MSRFCSTELSCSGLYVVLACISFFNSVKYVISNSYTMTCPPIRGDKSTSFSECIISRTAGQTWYSYFMLPNFNVDLAHHEMFKLVRVV